MIHLRRVLEYSSLERVQGNKVGRHVTPRPVRQISAAPRLLTPCLLPKRKAAPPPQAPKPLSPHHVSAAAPRLSSSNRSRTPSLPWRRARPTWWASTTGSARRSARAALASSSKAPTCSITPRSRSNSSPGRAMLPSCATSTARTRY